MKHFLIDITYIKNLDVVEQHTAAHREFLAVGYDRNMILFSGPKVPRTGGLIIARAGSEAEVRNFFQGDPFVTEGIAEYRFTEFNPVKRRAELEDWFACKHSIP